MPSNASQAHDDLALSPRTRAMIEERLVGNETIIASSRVHNGIYLLPLSLAVLTLLIAIFIATQIAFIMLIATAMSAVTAFIRQKILLIVITDKRIFARRGLLQIEFTDIRHDKVESLETERMLLGYLLGYANLVIMGTGNRYISIPYIANAEDLRKHYNQLQYKDE